VNRITNIFRPALALSAAAALAAAASAQTYELPPSTVPQIASTEAFPLLASDQLDTLIGAIALYPDALVAQILPASTYPVDVVRAARLVRSGATNDQIDQQDWDPSVKAVAHYPSVIEMMDQNIDWTQQLGQAFIAQPDDVMQSVQRQRERAQGVGNLVSTTQQQVYVENSVIRIVPSQPEVIYIPVYDPAVVYYTPPVYTTSYISFGVGYPCGSWFDLDIDWVNHWCYRPGWTWNHWRDNFYIERNHIRPRHDHDRRPGVRPSTVWHRDDHRPLTFSGHRLTRPSDFDRFRGRDNNNDHRRTPDIIHTPRPDRGWTRPGRTTPAPGLIESPRGRDNRDNRDNRNDGDGRNGRNNDRPTTPRVNPTLPSPTPRAPAPNNPNPRDRHIEPSQTVRPAPAPAPNPPRTRPAPKPTAAPVTRPPGDTHREPWQTVPRAAAPNPVRPAPARVNPPPVQVAPPPSAKPNPPAYVRPSSPAPAPSQAGKPSGRPAGGGNSGGGNRGGGGAGGKGGGRDKH
jgi:hypothetical protein